MCQCRTLCARLFCDEDVLGLDISVHDAAAVKVAQGRDDLEQPPRALCRGQHLALALGRGDPLPQVAARAVLHEQADDDVLFGVGVEEEVVVRGNVDVIAREEHLHLEQRGICRLEVLTCDSLEHRLLASDLVLHQVRRGKRAHPQLLEALVVLKARHGRR